MDRFYVISNSIKDPEGKIAKEIKAYLNFRGKQCIIQERQGKESLRSYKYTNAITGGCKILSHYFLINRRFRPVFF